MAHKCNYRGGCYTEWDQLDGEILTMIKVIYFNAVFFLVLAVYLYQIVPQSHGVAKHPCFCLKKLKRKALRRKSSAHAMENHIELTKEEIALEDDDVR